MPFHNMWHMWISQTLVSRNTEVTLFIFICGVWLSLFAYFVMSAETPKSQKGKRGSLRCQKCRHVVRHTKTYLHGFVYCKATLSLYSGWSAEKTYSVITLFFHSKRARKHQHVWPVLISDKNRARKHLKTMKTVIFFKFLQLLISSLSSEIILDSVLVRTRSVFPRTRSDTLRSSNTM